MEKRKFILKKNIPYDYEEIIFEFFPEYDGVSDPLDFIVFTEMLNNLRKAVSFLSYEEEGIINEIIIKEKSIISFAISLNISEFELQYRIEEALSLLHAQFRNL